MPSNNSAGITERVYQMRFSFRRKSALMPMLQIRALPAPFSLKLQRNGLAVLNAKASGRQLPGRRGREKYCRQTADYQFS
jgi:hypothetical protein